MEHYKRSKLLNNSIVLKFVTKKWIEVNDLSSGQYSVNENIRLKTSMLRLDLCDYSGAYIVVKGKITVQEDNDDKAKNKKLIMKNDAPFKSCISKINNTFIDNAKGLDILMPMYNLLEQSCKYSMTSGNLWIYYRDEVNDEENENHNANNTINNNETITSKSFEYKTKLIASTPNDNNTLNTEVFVP